MWESHTVLETSIDFEPKEEKQTKLQGHFWA